MTEKFLYFFSKRQKKYLLFLFSLMFIATFLEMTSLGFIFSIAGALSPESTTNGLFINKISIFLGLGVAEALSYLLLFFVFFYIVKIIFLAFYNWIESNFLFSYKENLSSKVFREYLNQNSN